MNVTYYSPISGVEHDLGTLYVTCDSLATDCHPIFVSISGPDYISTSGTYQWQATASGGDGTYTYQWYYRVDYQTPTCLYRTNWTLFGTGQTAQHYISVPGYDFDIQVTVTSGGHQQSQVLKAAVASHRSCPMSPVGTASDQNAGTPGGQRP